MKPVAAIHPSSDCLSRFGTGQLCADESAGVEAHVSDCTECCAVLRGVADDPFAALVRRATSAPPASRSGDTTPQFASRVLGEISADSTSPDVPLHTPEIVEVPAELREHPRYRVLELLGYGGMGTVYKAEHRLMQRTVALKLLARNLTKRPEVAERFIRETQTAARLTHANIVQAFDAEQAGDTLFLVMEFVPGNDLAQIVRERGPVPCSEACHHVRQAALALQHAHERGMVHRDIKPHNLMLTPGGEIKVLDFGLARFVLEQPLGESSHRTEEGRAGSSHLTEEGLFMGTADYVAPEQARDAHQADIRADIYSLGCTLYHLLTGQVPFPAGTVLDKVVKHATEQPAALSALRPDLPAGLEDVVRTMMAKLPDQRYRTPCEVAEALAPFASGAVTAGCPLTQPIRESASDLSRTAVLPAGAGRSSRERWRHRLVAMAAGFLLLAVAMAGVVVYRIQTDKGEIVIQTEDDEVEVVVKQGGKQITIYDPKSGQKLVLDSGAYELELKGKPTGLKLDLDSVTLRRGDRPIVKIGRTRTENKIGVAKVDPPILQPLHRIRWSEGPDASFLYDVDLSSDNRYFVATKIYHASPNHRVAEKARIWHLETGELVREFSDAERVRFTPDGKQMLSVGRSANFTVREVTTGTVVRRFGSGQPYSGMWISASGDRGGTVLREEPWKFLVFDWSTGKDVCKHDIGGILTPDGRHFLRRVGAPPRIQAYDARTGEEVNAYSRPRDLPNIGSISANGKSLVCLDGRNLKVYGVDSGNELGSFDVGTPGNGLLSRDGSRLLATSDSRTEYHVWDVTTRQVIARLRLPEPWHGMRAWTFSLDGQWAAFAGPTDSVYVFRIPLEEKAREAPGRAKIHEPAKIEPGGKADVPKEKAPPNLDRP